MLAVGTAGAACFALGRNVNLSPSCISMKLSYSNLCSHGRPEAAGQQKLLQRVLRRHPQRCLTLRKCRCSGSQQSLSYKSAGVDIDAGNELVRRIKKMNPSIGGFSGMVPFGMLEHVQCMPQQVCWCSSIDGWQPKGVRPQATLSWWRAQMALARS